MNWRQFFGPPDRPRMPGARSELLPRQRAVYGFESSILFACTPRSFDLQSIFLKIF